MNPEERAEYWRLVDQHRYEKSLRAKANPSEGDVVHDVYGTQVYLNSQWNFIAQMKPEDVAQLRKDWSAMRERQRIVQGIRDAAEKLRTAPKHPLGAHIHLGMDLDDEEETTYTEVELDNATLESYTQGKRDFANELLQLLAAEEAELKSYGRTELYGIHKAVSVIHKALSEIQQEEVLEQAQN